MNCALGWSMHWRAHDGALQALDKSTISHERGWGWDYTLRAKSDINVCLVLYCCLCSKTCVYVFLTLLCYISKLMLYAVLHLYNCYIIIKCIQCVKKS